MATPNIDKLLGQYREVAERSLVRVKRALDETRQREYSADKFVNDATSFWVDVATLWRAPYDIAFGGGESDARQRSK
jgi:hypothetical protein